MTPVEQYVLVAVAFALAIPCLLSLRGGIMVVLLVGFLQDPVRKLLPGAPVWLTVTAGAYVGITVLGALLRRESLSFAPIVQRFPRLGPPAVLFAILVVVQSGVTFYKTGSLALTGIGFLAYAAPLPTLLLGFHTARSVEVLRGILMLYVGIAVLMLAGVYLSVWGFQMGGLIEAVGEGLYAYAPTGGILTLHTGFFRGSELAGWHGATAAVFLVTLFLTRYPRSAPLLTSALVLYCLTAVLFTGRRKFLVEFLLFGAIVALALLSMARARGRAVVTGVALAAMVAISGSYLISDSFVERATPYVLRGLRVQDEAPERLQGLTIGAARYIIYRNGVLGAGAGLGSQGAQYFGGGRTTVGSAAEGGLGKVLAELGIPGVVLLAWLAAAAFLSMFEVVRHSGGREPARARLAICLAAFLVANAVVFLIAHQIFGDVFVLLLLGWVAGVIFAIPHMTFAPPPPRRIVPWGPAPPPARARPLQGVGA